MTITYTFLGKGGTGKTTIAFATAKRYAMKFLIQLPCFMNKEFLSSQRTLDCGL